MGELKREIFLAIASLRRAMGDLFVTKDTGAEEQFRRLPVLDSPCSRSYWIQAPRDDDAESAMYANRGPSQRDGT
jgi:hypothetical protein